jgi:hypothetical protein
MAIPIVLPSDITKSEEVCFDVYLGSVDSLISAGIITAAQVPGEQEVGKMMMTFYAGKRIGRGRVRHYDRQDEQYLRVVLVGFGKLRVFIGLAKEEEDRRRAAMLAEHEEHERRRLEWRRKLGGELACQGNPEDLRKRLAAARSDKSFQQFLQSQCLGE